MSHPHDGLFHFVAQGQDLPEDLTPLDGGNECDVYP